MDRLFHPRSALGDALLPTIRSARLSVPLTLTQHRTVTHAARGLLFRREQQRLVRSAPIKQPGFVSIVDIVGLVLALGDNGKELVLSLRCTESGSDDEN
jgi:hypothetical protein